MSHYSVLIIGPHPEEQLLPYDESLEIEFCDRTDEMRSKYENESVRRATFADGTTKDFYCPETKIPTLPAGAKLETIAYKDLYPDFDTFAKEYYGYEKNEQGRYGYMYNPKAKWDWYQHGGRWHNTLVLKSGKHVDEALWKQVDIAKLDPPFAVLKYGKWYEKGQMGWWAITTNEKADEVWAREVKQLIADIKPNTPVYIYDCHI